MTKNTSDIEGNQDGGALGTPRGVDVFLNSAKGEMGTPPSPSSRTPQEVKPSQTSISDEVSLSPASPDLGKFFSLVTKETSSHEWETRDLRAILSHQLSAPMVFDFCATIKSWVTTEQTRTWSGEEGKIPRSFQDLFTHTTPSMRLLKLTKEFAKANWKHPESPLPSEVAVVLYYTCIAVAFVRQGEWITKLSHGDAKSGFTWIQSQPWVDQYTKDICREAVAGLN